MLKVTFKKSRRGYKYLYIPNFRHTKKYQTVNTNQFFYTGCSAYDTDNLDILIPELLERKNVPGIVVILKVKDLETDRIAYGSDLFTKASIKRMKENNETIYDRLVNKLGSTRTHVVEFKFVSIHIRIIYEKVKAGKKEK